MVTTQQKERGVVWPTRCDETYVESQKGPSQIPRHKHRAGLTTMDLEQANSQALIDQLITGLETLQDEYRNLFGQQDALERKLATARDQVRAS